MKGVISTVQHLIHRQLQNPAQTTLPIARSMINLLFNKISIVPLMAQPFEIINITISNSELTVQPPEKPSG